jgi:4-diphosphocytidyl-2-C-methyl-D-erythritol kinase
MESLRIKTPAKINIGLNITGKRLDGYHNIETVFYPVNIFDYLILETSDSFTFQSNNSIVNSEEENTVIKAKQIIEKTTGVKITAKIYLEKNIPIGAGMGGGSSDGAAALIALNEFFNLKLDKERLKDLALEIGSDVPFFIEPCPCIAQSRGEILEKIKLTIPCSILIVNPGIHISTGWAYNSITSYSTTGKLINLIKNNTLQLSQFKEFVTNDFEKIVFQIHPEIENIKNQLYSMGAIFVLMTGSGSTVYGIFLDFEKVQAAKNKFPMSYFTFIHS